MDSLRSHFVAKSDIMQMVNSRSRKLAGISFDSISSRKIEEYLNNYAPVNKAEVYKTADGAIHIDIYQRNPVLRIINRYGENYYIDDRGEALQHSSRYSTHVLVANGYINRRAPGQKSFHVSENNPGSKRNILQELYELACYINDRKLWKAQIQQIYVDEDGDFELIPRVGAHIIVFGKFDRPDEKFSKLEALYRNGLNVEGWNTFDAINLKYEGQIVCTKRK
jgi:cell division protein FtsQ